MCVQNLSNLLQTCIKFFKNKINLAPPIKGMLNIDPSLNKIHSL